MLLIYTYLFLVCSFLIPLYKLVDIPRLLRYSVFAVFNPIHTKLGLDFRFVLFWVVIYLVGFFVFAGLISIVGGGEFRQKIRMLTKSLGMAVLDYLILIFVPILIGVALFLRFLSEPLLCVGFILMLATIFDQLSLSKFRKGGGYGKLITAALIGMLLLVLSLSTFAYLFPLDVEKTFQLGQRYHFILQKNDLYYYWYSESGREVRLGKGQTESIGFLRKNVAVLEAIKSMIRKKVSTTLALATSYDLVVLKDDGYYYYRGYIEERKLAWQQENTIRYLIEHPALVSEIDAHIAQKIAERGGAPEEEEGYTERIGGGKPILPIVSLEIDSDLTVEPSAIDLVVPSTSENDANVRIVKIITQRHSIAIGKQTISCTLTSDEAPKKLKYKLFDSFRANKDGFFKGRFLKEKRVSGQTTKIEIPLGEKLIGADGTYWIAFPIGVILVNEDAQKSERITLTAEVKTPLRRSIVYVESEPSDASVYLDDKVQGKTPLSIPNITLGRHIVKVSKRGFYDWTQQIDIAHEQSVELKAVLKKITAATEGIQITSVLDGQSVPIDKITIAGIVKTKETVTRVLVNGRQASVISGDNIIFNYLLTLSPGANSVTIVAETSSGKQLEQTITIVYKKREYVSFETEYFIIRLYDVKRDSKYVGKILDDLKSAYFKVGNNLGFFPANKVDITVYASTEQYLKAIRTTPWSAACYDPADDRIHIKTAAQLDAIIHEYAHLVVQSMTKGNHPTWLTEGIAVFSETEQTHKYYKRVIKQNRAKGRWLKLKEIANTYPADDDLVYLAYGEYFSLVDFIVQKYTLAKLQLLLYELRTKDTIDKAIFDALGVDYQTFEQLWEEYIQTSQDYVMLQAPVLYFLAWFNEHHPQMTQKLLN